jgi:hypothetical protein
MLAPRSFGFPGEHLLETSGVFKLSVKEAAVEFVGYFFTASLVGASFVLISRFCVSEKSPAG